jgi:hypothetical protein
MSSLVAIGLAALGASMVSDDDVVTYWIAGRVGLPESGCDSLGEAWIDYEDGTFITREFVGSFTAPRGLQLEDRRVHDEAFRLLHQAVEHGWRGPDEIQTRWINEVIGRKKWYDRPTVDFYAIEGGQLLYLEQDTMPGREPYLRSVGRAGLVHKVQGLSFDEKNRAILQEPPVSKKQAMTRMLGRMPYTFILLKDGALVRRRVETRGYNEAIDVFDGEIEKFPVLLAVREGRVLVPEDQRSR